MSHCLTIVTMEESPLDSDNDRQLNVSTDVSFPSFILVYLLMLTFPGIKN